MVSQFISSHQVPLLGGLAFKFPEGANAVGRLDKNSEGLLLLTTNTKVVKLLFQGPVPHKRTYYVWVRGIVTPQELQQLRNGVNIVVKEGKSYLTPAIEAEICSDPPHDYEFPYKINLYVQYSWLKMTLYEGKFHQVRKMVEAIGHPCKRLIRTAIEDITLDNLAPGEVVELDETTFFKRLHIDYP